MSKPFQTREHKFDHAFIGGLAALPGVVIEPGGSLTKLLYHEISLIASINILCGLLKQLMREECV